MVQHQSLSEEASELRVHAGCRSCGAKLKRSFVDLGMSPLCESYRSEDQLDTMEPFYPLHVLVCEECLLVQLKEYVAPEHIFREYAYFSSYSTSWVEHARTYCSMIRERLALGRNSLVVELASNDGYLLQHFLPFGIPVIGIEPAHNVAQVALAKGIETRTEFFGLDLAKRIVAEGRRADLIIANNVLPHVPNLNDFVAGLAHLLKPDGIATLEFPHLARLIEESQFDTIYHEHFSYLSLLAVDAISSRHGLEVIDVEELPTHGGSLRVYWSLRQPGRRPKPSVADLLAHERDLGLDRLETYTSFTDQVRRTKRQLLALLIELKSQGKRICGYGAPGKGNTLLNYCGIGPDFIDFTVDRNPYKHALYTPGMNIPIRPVTALDEAKPDYILILPWNLKDEIICQMRHVAEWGAKFIIPIPRATVIDPMEIFS
ncbi:class I SAM-dependent methyltransferase [Microvirga tunisiensis]|uniref:class I SAM-dependent methyltransferase n=1 Tax=Microvirga tunisiensis TaxID=2108360 RepID=UPI00237C16E3|nr:class I SAM-dependent methyltransferase [Microvirga tunisiensis]